MAYDIRTTYTDTDIAKRGISDLVKMIEWTQAPLLFLLGTNNETKLRLAHWPRTKVEWMEDTMSPRSTTLNNSGNLAADGTSVVVTDASVFKVGDLVQGTLTTGDRASDLAYVSAVSTSTNTLTISRDYAGTTGAIWADSAAIHLTTIARKEAADYTTGHTTTIELPYNYTQILSEAVKVSGSELKNEEYGINDHMAYHIAKLIGGGDGVGGRGKAGKLPILLQQTFYYGVRSVGTDDLSRSMGGFHQYVSSHVTDKNGAVVTRKDVEDTFENCFLDGGMPDTIVTNTWGKRKISSWYEGLISTDRSEERGGSRITMVETDFGDMEVVHDRWCPQDRMYIIEKDCMGWLEYRPWDIYDRPEMGDYKVREVLGEYTFALTNEEANGYIHGFSTSR